MDGWGKEREKFMRGAFYPPSLVGKRRRKEERKTSSFSCFLWCHQPLSVSPTTGRKSRPFQHLFFPLSEQKGPATETKRTKFLSDFVLLGFPQPWVESKYVINPTISYDHIKTPDNFLLLLLQKEPKEIKLTCPLGRERNATRARDILNVKLYGEWRKRGGGISKAASKQLTTNLGQKGGM